MASRAGAEASLIEAFAFLLAAASELPFEPWFVERNVAVEIARVAEGVPWIRATGELPASAEAVYAVVTDYARYRELFAPAVETARVLESQDASARIHLVWPYPFPFRRRDAVVAYRGERREGVFVLSWRNDALPGDPKEGVRIERVEGETRIEALGDGRCRVTYVYLADLGGKFPKAVEEKAWRHEPLGYFYALRRRLGLSIPPK